MKDEEIIQNIPLTLKTTNFNIGKRYEGKVRDNYILEGKRIFVTTDRISCFDSVVGTLPFKGQILNQIATFWFNKTKDIVDNHLIESPDPVVAVVKECKPLPVEVVVRGYITGSLWRDYEKGGREMYGLSFEDGLKKDQRFPEPIITPTTKAEKGVHDEAITEKEIIDCIVIIPDSAGSLIELGMLAITDEAHFKTLVLFNESHKPQMNTNFVGLGAKAALDNKARTKIIDYNNKNIAFAEVSNFLEYIRGEKVWDQWKKTK